MSEAVIGNAALCLQTENKNNSVWHSRKHIY